jgi:hypothetical protein
MQLVSVSLLFLLFLNFDHSQAQCAELLGYMNNVEEVAGQSPAVLQLTPPKLFLVFLEIHTTLNVPMLLILYLLQLLLQLHVHPHCQILLLQLTR